MCDAALPRVEQAARWLGVTVDVVDIDSDFDLESEYHLRIPVVLDRAGRVVAEGRISLGRALVAAALSVR